MPVPPPDPTVMAPRASHPSAFLPGVGEAELLGLGADVLQRVLGLHDEPPRRGPGGAAGGAPLPPGPRGGAALVLAPDPQAVLYGGGLSRSADVVLDPPHREPTKHCLRLPEPRASALGDESVALGAVRLALDEVDSRLLSDGLAAPTAPRR
ncbi:hypothetical protein GCM10010240_55610 [Streptomyces griseoviridis]|nr:hypothetical protein GCM10010240_55610 [Streptomyces griseoviridis]